MKYITPVTSEGIVKEGLVPRDELGEVLGADLVVEVTHGLFVAEWYGGGVLGPGDIGGYEQMVTDAGYSVEGSRIDDTRGPDLEDTPQVYFRI